MNTNKIELCLCLTSIWYLYRLTLQIKQAHFIFYCVMTSVYMLCIRYARACVSVYLPRITYLAQKSSMTLDTWWSLNLGDQQLLRAHARGWHGPLDRTKKTRERECPMFVWSPISNSHHAPSGVHLFLWHETLWVFHYRVSYWFSPWDITFALVWFL